MITSCDDYVDIEEKGLLIPNTLEDLRLVLNNDNSFHNASHTHDYFINDDITIPASKISDFRGALSYSLALEKVYGLQDHFYTEEQDDSNWNLNYELIGIANYALDRLNIIDENNDDLRNQIKGEALVHRAYSYLNLINLYAQHYAYGDPNADDSGVPLITEFANPDTSLKRASIQEVYDQIISDLTEASTLLKNDISSNTQKVFPSKAVAYSLLARTYLHTEQYQLAIDNANKALAIQNTLIHYPTELANLNNTIGDPTGAITPTLFETTEIIMHKRGVVPAKLDFVFVPSFSIVLRNFTYITPEVVALYDQINDTRFTHLITAELDFTTFTNNYRWNGGDSTYLYHLADLTVPEVLLIRAESFARLGNINSAMSDVNILRQNRIDSTDPTIVNLTASNQSEAIQKVLEEKRRELLFRGTRFFDIKRLNAIDNAGISITRNDFEGQQVTMEANGLKWALPIPRKEILLAPEIIQNPR